MNTPQAPLPEAATRLRVVLVGTQHPGNIGAAARAIKTMGLSRLVLVDPLDFPSDEAFRRAAGADDVLAAAPVVAGLADAVSDCHMVLGCTARSRRVALDELDPRAAASQALGRAADGGEVALVFGRERTGLSNEELQLCHAAIHIPANPAYSSLNLAAAVQVLTYELRMAMLQAAGAHVVPGLRNAPVPGVEVSPDAQAPANPIEGLASHAQLEGMFAQLGQALDDIDFHKGRAPDSAMRKLRRLFLRAAMSEQEVRLVRGILADAQRMARLASQRSQ